MKKCHECGNKSKDGYTARTDSDKRRRAFFCRECFDMACRREDVVDADGYVLYEEYRLLCSDMILWVFDL